MLVVTRKKGQRVLIGDNVVVEVRQIHSNEVRIGIEAPLETPIRREELEPLLRDLSEKVDG